MMTKKATETRWSTIGRSVDLRVPTNLAIAAITALSFVAGTLTSLIQGQGIGAGLLIGLSWGGSMFLAWALARELDPDRWYSAFFAAAGALAGTILLGSPHFLMLFWFLLAVRFINRSTGLPPGLLDFGGIYGIKLWLGLTAHWAIPLLTLPSILFAGLRRLSMTVRILLKIGRAHV